MIHTLTSQEEYRQRTPKSEQMWASAQQLIPGGFSQGTRHFAPYPFYCQRMQGYQVQDVDGNWYTDYWLAASANTLGHAHPVILDAVRKQLDDGCNGGIPFPHELEAAELIIKLVPSAQRVKFTNSGMDACMLACRVARVFTGRTDIGVFEGHFHGWEDQVMKGYGKARGIPPAVQENIIVFPFNDLQAVADAIKRHNFAAMILEPFSTNAGAIPTDPAFLRELRRLCTENDIVLIYDEVVTNFRFAVGGAQEYFGVIPDLTALGKPLAGGFTTIGALAGRADIMQVTDHNTHSDYVYHGVWMMPVVMEAVKAALSLIADGALIRAANARGDRLRKGLDNIFERAGIPVQNVGIGSAVRSHFTDRPIRTLADVRQADKKRLTEFHLGLVNRGHFVLPGRNAYVSLVTPDAEIDRHLDDAELVVRRMQG